MPTTRKLTASIGKCQGHLSNPLQINMLVISTPDGPATGTCSKTHNTADTTPADTMPTLTNDEVNAPPTLTVDKKILLG